MNNTDYSKFFSSPNEIKLAKAIMDGDHIAVRRLSDSGVNVNAVGKNEVTPLRIALKHRQKKIVILLLELGVDPNYTTPGKAVPAFAATELDDSSYLELLLDHGLDLNIKQAGQPLIFAAIRRGIQWSSDSPRQWDNYHLLIRQGADIHQKTTNGTSLVLELVSVSQYDLATQLILKGVDFRTPDRTGLSVIDILTNDQKAMGANPNDSDFKKRAAMLLLLHDLRGN